LKRKDWEGTAVNEEPGINIRPYRPTNWDRLCQIHDAARKHELAAAGLSAAFLTLAETAENEGLFDGTVVVAELAGIVQGFVAFTDDELTWLYVAPAAYRQGVGRALLRYALAHTANTVATEVLVGNEAALQLYLAEGFQLVRRVDGNLTGNEAFTASGYILQHTKT
jgi:GNAT superfamily N-acetyltransferase